MAASCDDCTYNIYDEEMDAYFCEAPLDEDELCRLLAQGQSCPYYRRDGGDYALVRHQN